MTPQRAERLHQLSRTLQSAEEARLQSAKMQAEAVRSEVRATRHEKEAAFSRRNQCTSGVDWQLWQAYIEALEVRAQDCEQRLEVLTARVQEQQEVTTRAYQEAKRWEAVAREAAAAARQKSIQREQRELDEGAVLRHLRRRG